MDGFVLLFVIIVGAVAIWQWFKQRFPLTTKATTIVVKGAWTVTKAGYRVGRDAQAACKETITCRGCRRKLQLEHHIVCTQCGFRGIRNVCLPCPKCGHRGPGYVNCRHCNLSTPYWTPDEN